MAYEDKYKELEALAHSDDVELSGKLRTAYWHWATRHSRLEGFRVFARLGYTQF